MKWLLSIILVSLGETSLVWASQAQTYGLEAQSSGRTGSVTAESTNPHAALFNPSLLGAQSQASFSFSTGITQVKVDAIGPVVLPQSHRRADGTSQGHYQLPSLSETRWALGATVPLRLKFTSRKVGLGLSASGPYEKLRSFNAYAPDDFYTARYGTADGQFKCTSGVGVELVPDRVFLGAALSLFLSGAGTAETTLSTTPTSRMNLNVVLQNAPVFGLYTRWGTLASALTFHQSIHPQLEQTMNARIPILDKASIQQPVAMKSALYYEPQMLEWDIQERWNKTQVSLGLAYQVWSPYQAPILLTETQDADGTRYQTQDTQVATRNTWNPRVSVGYDFSPQWKSFLGYQFRPTPFYDLSGTANILDSNTHIIGAALQYHFSQTWLSDTPLALGVFGQLHHFEKRTISKQGSGTAGYPEVNFSGNALHLGVSAQVAL